MMKCIYLFIFFLTLTAGAYSQWSSDPSENTRVTNGGLLPQIISDGSGGAYIVYQDSPALLRQLWVQWLDRDGFVRFPDNGIRVSAPDRNQTPTYFLVSDSTGGVIVAFEDFQEISGETFTGVYAQRLDSSGTKLWEEAGVEISPPADVKGPVSACSDGDNGAFVFWGEDADSNGAFELRGQRVSATGELVWPDNGIVITDEFSSFNVATPNPAVSDGASGAIILYSDSSEAKLQRINPEGKFLWENGIDTIYINGKMFTDNAGGAILAGRHVNSENIISYRALRINGQGNLVWGTDGIVVKDSVESNLIPIPDVAFSQKGETTIVWQEKINDFADIYYNKVRKDGELVFANKIKISVNESKRVAPKVISSDNSTDIMFWYDNRDDVNFDIYTRKLSQAGQNLWNENDIAISSRTTSEKNFQIISDKTGGALVSWYEVGIGSGFGIFAQQVSRNGNLGELLVTSVSQPNESSSPFRYLLHQSYPNPFNAEVMIKYELPESNFVTLTIFDITGKEVINLINKEQPPGIYQANWNGKNQKGGDVASGIYIYQLRTGSFVQVKEALFIK